MGRHRKERVDAPERRTTRAVADRDEVGQVASNAIAQPGRRIEQMERRR